MVRFYLLLAALLCVADLSLGQQKPATAPSGSVEGVVLDDNGKPLPDARVYALQEQDMLKPISTTQSDSQGNFILRNIPAGEVYLHVYKESEGYPDNRFAFYTDGRLNKVTVVEGQPTTGVTVRLGPKAAYLDLNITSQDGTPVSAGAVFTRLDIDVPDLYTTSVAPKETLMVPPVAFRLRIEAEGYLPWHYGGPNWQGKDGIIELKSGETLNLRILLTPLH